MVSQLNEKIALPIGHGASPAEIVDIFESYISSSTNVRDAVHKRLIAERVKYPLEEPNLIEKYENIGNRRGFLKVGSPFSFFDGGCFISNKEIVSDTNLASVLKLLASLVSYDRSCLSAGQSESDIGKYNHLPTVLLKFAFGSRVDTGQRLLSRCCRHAFDPKMKPITEAEVQFFKYKDGKFSFFIYMYS